MHDPDKPDQPNETDDGVRNDTKEDSAKPKNTEQERTHESKPTSSNANAENSESDDDKQSNLATHSVQNSSDRTSMDNTSMDNNTPIDGFPLDDRPHRAHGRIGLAIVFNVFLILSFVVAVLFLVFKSGEKDSGLFVPITETPKIGVVHLLDAISYETVHPIIQWIDSLKNQPDVKALVFCINSPGGTVAASQELYHAIMRFKNRDERHPVFAASIDVNASGAYWISCAADKIFANHGSTVGSIGVIRTGLSFEGLMEKLGVTDTTVTSVEYKDMGSMYRDLSDSEREIILSEIRSIHNHFVEIVWESRKHIKDLTREKLENEIAVGLTFTGKQALMNGLVDELKPFPEVIELMKTELVMQKKISDPSKIQLVYPPQPALKLNDLFNIFGKRSYHAHPTLTEKPMRELAGTLLPEYVTSLPLLLYTGYKN